MEQRTGSERPIAAFVTSLIAGLIILIGGVLASVTWAYWGYASWGGMMGPWMMGWGMMSWIWPASAIIGLVSGIVVTIGALMLNSRPTQAQTWGTIILVFSIVSLIGMGGFVVGAILGIIGGILALTWRTA